MILSGPDEAFVISSEDSDRIPRLGTGSGELERQRVSGLTA